MKTLVVTGDAAFEDVNVFTIESLRQGSVCTLHKDYNKPGDGIMWAMLHSGVISDSKEYNDCASNRRAVAASNLIKQGEIVMIEGAQYKIRLLGRYSDCAIFDPVDYSK